MTTDGTPSAAQAGEHVCITDLFLNNYKNGTFSFKFLLAG
jgi:hypothetical protein